MMSEPHIYKALYKVGVGDKFPAFSPSGDASTFYEEMDAYRFKFGFSKTRGLVAAMMRESLERAELARSMQVEYADLSFQAEDSPSKSADALWKTYQRWCDEEEAMGGSTRALTHVLEFMDYMLTMYIHADNRPVGLQEPVEQK